MRVKADLELCQGHAICQMEAPEIFRVRERPDDHDQVEVLQGEIPEALRQKLEAAVRYCPNRVLSIVEDEGRNPRRAATDPVGRRLHGQRDPLEPGESG
jgi:ferredoxin